MRTPTGLELYSAVLVDDTGSFQAMVALPAGTAEPKGGQLSGRRLSASPMDCFLVD